MYWAKFWLISYADGYDRRALIGQFARMFTDRIETITLNAIAFGIVAVILAWIYTSYFSKFFDRKHVLPLSIILSGPTSTVLFEVLGDPLHFCFLVVLLYSVLARLVAGRINLNRGVALLSACAVILIHEASFFIFLPAIYFIYCATTGAIFRFHVAAVSVVLLSGIFSLALSDQTPTGYGIGLVLKDGVIVHVAAEALPSFGVLLKAELASYFSSFDAFIYLMVKTLGVALWPLIAIFVLAGSYGDNRLPRVFFTLLVLSSPLYVIAHDWGRFTIYTLLLSMLISAISAGRPMQPSIAPVRFDPFRSIKWNVIASVIDERALYFFPLFFFAHPRYRIDGLTQDNLVYLLAALLLLLVFNAGRDRAR